MKMNPNKFTLLSDLEDMNQVDPMIIDEYQSDFGIPNIEMDSALKDQLPPDQSIPELQAPAMLQGNMPEMADPTREDQLAKIRQDLMARIKGYDQEALDAQKAQALEESKPGWDKQLASIVGSGLMGGAGKVAFADLDKQEQARRKEIMGEYDAKKSRFDRDTQSLMQFDALDRAEKARQEARQDKSLERQQANTKWERAQKLAEDKFELDAKKVVQGMSLQEIDMKIKQQLFSDTMAAKDPKSEQSVGARELVREFTGKTIPENMSAAQLAPMVSKLPELIKKKAEQDIKTQAEATKPSEGEKTLDREFAKTWNNWQTQGKPQYLENAKLFEDAIRKVETGEVDTGFIEGLKGRQGFVDTKTKALEREVRSAINGMLRQTLGAQFTEKEGERIFAQAFDPKAKPEDNIKSMRRELGKIQKTADSIESQGMFFEENRGSLKGYKAPKIKEQRQESNQPFPRQVRKGNQVATVSNQQELEEAMQEGFK